MLRLFRYGMEATEYLQGSILPEPLVSLVLARLDKGEVSAMLPEYTDPADLPKFKTDIFWGKPARGREIMDYMTSFYREFLAESPQRLLITESGWERDRSRRPGIPFYLYRSALSSEPYVAVAPYLTSELANEDAIHTFLLESWSYYRATLLCELPAGRELCKLIRHDELVSSSALEELANHTVHLITPAYDLTAYLVWTSL